MSKCSCGYELKFFPIEQEMLDTWGCARTVIVTDPLTGARQMAMCSNGQPPELEVEDDSELKRVFAQKYEKPKNEKSTNDPRQS